jgi:predicted transcriptional regulator
MAMDIKGMLQFLIKQGFTELDIAKAIQVNQSTVSRILSGHIRDPKGSLVNEIKSLFEFQKVIALRNQLNLLAKEI